jgi:hypothetical protein
MERFSESNEVSENGDGNLCPQEPGPPQNLKRFLRILAARKQQILERILMDEE